ncbi:MAG: prepilin-type N-terminal cleavage/methylation domain-containing protein, partial [Desulforhopalus sp.]
MSSLLKKQIYSENQHNVHEKCGLNQRGFTLIELLIAMFIFAIVVSSVYGAYRSSFHVIHGSEYQLQVANNARIVLERLSEDLEAILPG